MTLLIRLDAISQIYPAKQHHRESLSYATGDESRTEIWKKLVAPIEAGNAISKIESILKEVGWLFLEKLTMTPRPTKNKESEDELRNQNNDQKCKVP